MLALSSRFFANANSIPAQERVVAASLCLPRLRRLANAFRVVARRQVEAFLAWLPSTAKVERVVLNIGKGIAAFAA